jgi:uncharacterized membrane protein YfcA
MFSALMVHWRYLWLVAASLLAGMMNAMAGGGSFLSFPAMLGVGVPPIEASVLTLRRDVQRRLLPVVLGTSLVGGVCGAEVLLHTRQLTFLHMIPWLLLGGALLFWASGPVSSWLRQRAIRRSSTIGADSQLSHVWLGLSLLPACFYVGYFGAGSGFLIMTILALLGMDDMHQLNAMKIVTATASNLCAIVTFVASGRIVWHDCLVSMVFAAGGGYLGARYARRMNPAVLRSVVVITGLAIAGYFFWRNG